MLTNQRFRRPGWICNCTTSVCRWRGKPAEHLCVLSVIRLHCMLQRNDHLLYVMHENVWLSNVDLICAATKDAHACQRHYHLATNNS